MRRARDAATKREAGRADRRSARPGGTRTQASVVTRAKLSAGAIVDGSRGYAIVSDG